MKKFLFLILVLTIPKGWAPPPTKNEITPKPDISTCDLNPKEQTKVTLVGVDGKRYSICTGQAACGGKTVPVSCKVSERELCPVAKKCIVFTKPSPELLSFVAHKFDVLVGNKSELELKKIDLTAPSIISKKMLDLKMPSGEKFQGIKILASNSPTIKFSEKTRITIEPGKSYEILENKPQYWSIGLFQGVTGRNISKNCSGALIRNPNLQGKTKWAVLTAASCVYDRETDTWVQQGARFIPNFPFNRGVILQLKFSVIPSDFLNSFNPNYQAFDYALIAGDGDPPENCCLNLMILGTSSDSHSGIFPIYSDAIQLIQSRRNFFLFETIMVGFESPGSYDTNYFRLVKNDINLRALGKGAPWIGKNPQNGQEGFVFGLNAGNIDDRPGIIASPVLGKTFEKMWKCIEDEMKACPEMGL